MALSFIGKPISVISHSDIRYRGILAGIDPQASTIQLENVYSMGTESRRPTHQYIAPVPEPNAYIVFRSLEVKDLSVDEQAPHQRELAQEESIMPEIALGRTDGVIRGLDTHSEDGLPPTSLYTEKFPQCAGQDASGSSQFSSTSTMRGSKEPLHDAAIPTITVATDPAPPPQDNASTSTSHGASTSSGLLSPYRKLSPTHSDISDAGSVPPSPMLSSHTYYPTTLQLRDNKPESKTGLTSLVLAGEDTLWKKANPSLDGETFKSVSVMPVESAPLHPHLCELSSENSHKDPVDEQQQPKKKKKKKKKKTKKENEATESTLTMHQHELAEGDSTDLAFLFKPFELAAMSKDPDTLTAPDDMRGSRESPHDAGITATTDLTPPPLDNASPSTSHGASTSSSLLSPYNKLPPTHSDMSDTGSVPPSPTPSSHTATKVPTTYQLRDNKPKIMSWAQLAIAHGKKTNPSPGGETSSREPLHDAAIPTITVATDPAPPPQDNASTSTSHGASTSSGLLSPYNKLSPTHSVMSDDGSVPPSPTPSSHTATKVPTPLQLHDYKRKSWATLQSDRMSWSLFSRTQREETNPSLGSSVTTPVTLVPSAATTNADILGSDKSPEVPANEQQQQKQKKSRKANQPAEMTLTAHQREPAQEESIDSSPLPFHMPEIALGGADGGIRGLDTHSEDSEDGLPTSLHTGEKFPQCAGQDAPTIPATTDVAPPQGDASPSTSHSASTSSGLLSPYNSHTATKFPTPLQLHDYKPKLWALHLARQPRRKSWPLISSTQRKETNPSLGSSVTTPVTLVPSAATVNADMLSGEVASPKDPANEQQHPKRDGNKAAEMSLTRHQRELAHDDSIDSAYPFELAVIPDPKHLETLTAPGGTDDGFDTRSEDLTATSLHTGENPPQDAGQDPSQSILTEPSGEPGTCGGDEIVFQAPIVVGKRKRRRKAKKSSALIEGMLDKDASGKALKYLLRTFSADVASEVRRAEASTSTRVPEAAPASTHPFSPMLLNPVFDVGADMSIAEFCENYGIRQAIHKKLDENGYDYARNLRFVTLDNLTEMGFKLGEKAALRDAVERWAVCRA